MNGLPQDIHLGALIGANVDQVCIGQHQCIIRLGDAVQIAIESSCVLRDARGNETKILDYPAAATALCTLLGTEVESATRTSDGGLRIRVSTGAELSILNDVYEYEAFQVHIHGKVYVA